jgi:acetyl/propionyl-CoA carboxylase alpha subunit
MVEISADIDASVWQVRVEVGQEVTEGEELIVLESMKMEIPVEASSAAVTVPEGDHRVDVSRQQADIKATTCQSQPSSRL